MGIQRVRRAFLNLFCSQLKFRISDIKDSPFRGKAQQRVKGNFLGCKRIFNGQWVVTGQQKNSQQKGICKTKGLLCFSSIQEYKHLCLGSFFQTVGTAALYIFSFECTTLGSKIARYNQVYNSEPRRLLTNASAGARLAPIPQRVGSGLLIAIEFDAI